MSRKTRYTEEQAQILQQQIQSFLTEPRTINQISEYVQENDLTVIRKFGLLPMMSDNRITKLGDKRSAKYIDANVEYVEEDLQVVNIENLAKQIEEFLQNNLFQYTSNALAKQFNTDIGKIRLALKYLINKEMVNQIGNRRSAVYAHVNISNTEEKTQSDSMVEKDVKTFSTTTYTKKDVMKDKTELFGTSDIKHNKRDFSNSFDLLNNLLKPNKKYQIEELRKMIIDNCTDVDTQLSNDIIINSAKSNLLGYAMEHTDHGHRMHYWLNQNFVREENNVVNDNISTEESIQESVENNQTDCQDIIG